MRGLRASLTLLLLVLLISSVPALAVSFSQSSVLITEIQTGSTSSASEEFIELANTTDAPVDLTNWRLEYFSAGTTPLSQPFRTIPLHGVMEPGGYHLILSTNYLSDMPTDQFVATLAKAGGHLRLVNQTGPRPVVEDTVGWGTAMSPETAAAPAPAGGSSLMRRADEQGNYQDTNSNLADFELTDSPTPGVANVVVPAETPTDEPIAVPSEPDQPVLEPATPEATPAEPVDEPINPAPLEISELLPNPAAPATDGSDEFIELYNPTDEAVSLKDYRLETSSSFNYDFTFDDQQIPAHSYKAFTSADTKLVLANGDGRARLLGPDESVVAETLPYSGAKEGEAWGNINGIWQWTITPTPDAANLLNVAAVKTAATRAPAKKATPKATVKKSVSKASTKKSTAKAASTKKTAKPATPAKVAAVADEAADDKPVAPIHPGVLAGIAGLALVYGAYEYRHDLANKIAKFRSNRSARRAAGA